MSTPGPWYISAHAVRRYLEIVGRRNTPTEFSRAEDELLRMAKATVASDRQPKQAHQRLLRYRGPPPLRLRFLVSTDVRPEGPLPQLVDVLPTHGKLTRGW